ncbi:MAG: hypothetical protein ACYTBJ_00685 [Planctomycetota bacterium]|jgi:hypothetical protein
MKRNFWKALGLFVLAGTVHIMVLGNTRDMMLWALAQGSVGYIIGAILGGASWYIVPGLLCYYLSTRAGHVHWGKYSGLNALGVGAVMILWMGDIYTMPFIILAGVVGLVNAFILVKLLKVPMERQFKPVKEILKENEYIDLVDSDGTIHTAKIEKGE